MNDVMNLTRFILEEQKAYPEAYGELTNVLLDIIFASKLISREVNKAGLVDILGSAGRQNSHRDEVQKLDVYAQEVFEKILLHTGHICGLASEEKEEIILVPKGYHAGKYTLTFDPLDGSSNIDVNVSVGSIFSIHRKISAGQDADRSDFLQPGRNQVAAGYILYGSSTMLVYTTGKGVHSFTLDPSIGEYLLTAKHITFPKDTEYYSVNEGYWADWDESTRKIVDGLKANYSARHVGSLVADFHRNLLVGGVHLSPATVKRPEGKLRLLYESAPLAFIAEQAGGLASDGKQNILDIQPTDIHQRTPLFIGSRDEVAKIQATYAK